MYLLLWHRMNLIQSFCILSMHGSILSIFERYFLLLKDRLHSSQKCPTNKKKNLFVWFNSFFLLYFQIQINRFRFVSFSESNLNPSSGKRLTCVCVSYALLFLFDKKSEFPFWTAFFFVSEQQRNRLRNFSIQNKKFDFKRKTNSTARFFFLSLLNRRKLYFGAKKRVIQKKFALLEINWNTTTHFTDTYKTVCAR